MISAPASEVRAATSGNNLSRFKSGSSLEGPARQRLLFSLLFWGKALVRSPDISCLQARWAPPQHSLYPWLRIFALVRNDGVALYDTFDNGRKSGLVAIPGATWRSRL